jgi:hypothetical protein
MSGKGTARVILGWQRNTHLEAVVWDGAPTHRSEEVQVVGFPLVSSPHVPLN